MWRYVSKQNTQVWNRELYFFPSENKPQKAQQYTMTEQRIQFIKYN